MFFFLNIFSLLWMCLCEPLGIVKCLNIHFENRAGVRALVLVWWTFPSHRPRILCRLQSYAIPKCVVELVWCMNLII